MRNWKLSLDASATMCVCLKLCKGDADVECVFVQRLFHLKRANHNRLTRSALVMTTMVFGGLIKHHAN